MKILYDITYSHFVDTVQTSHNINSTRVLYTHSEMILHANLLHVNKNMLIVQGHESLLFIHIQQFQVTTMDY